MQMTSARTLLEIRPSTRTELESLLQQIEWTPTHCTVKGMYVNGIFQALRKRGFEANEFPEFDRVRTFQDYDLRRYMQLLLDSAVTLYPDDRPKQSLRKLGQLAIPTFGDSVIGRVILSSAGQSWELSLKFLSRGYEASLKPGRATVTELSKGRAVVQLREVWNFGDSYQVGVVEGLMRTCDLTGRIQPQLRSHCNVDLLVEWDERAPTKSKRHA